jgi:hypothetical protein
MDDEETVRFVADLKTLLSDNGFEWAIQEAEAGVAEQQRGQRSHAVALLNAAESLTIDLAQAEAAIYDTLNVERVVFLQDTDREFSSEDRAQFQRRYYLSRQTELANVFDELRAEINVDD